MKSLFEISAVVVFSVLAVFTLAQVPEGIITESGDQDDTTITTESDFMTDIVEHTLIKENRLLAYDNPREADVPWSKKLWRVIDTRQMINSSFSYRKMPLVSVLLEEVRKGNIVAFVDDTFEETQSHESVMATLNLRDTVPVFDPETQVETWEVVENEFNPDLIKKYRVYEVWYFDKQASRLKVRILGLSPVRDVLNEMGEFTREEPMFWVNLNQAREYLNDYPVYNPNNDSAAMTWADMFDSRQFGSFIYKETNVRDDRLDLVHSEDPIEMLYRSQEIEEELFNFEQDFWSY